MKKSFLIIAITLLSIYADAQKCKYSKNTIDPISKQTIKITDNSILSNRNSLDGNILASACQKVGDSIFIDLGLTVKTVKTCEMSSSKNSIATLLFSDETTLELKTYSDTKSVLFSQQYFGRFQYAIDNFYYISKEDLLKILDKKVKLIRMAVNYNGKIETKDTELKDGKMLDLSSQLKCVM